MKKHLILTQLVASAVLLLSGKVQAQDTSPSAASDAGNSTSIILSSFTRQLADTTKQGPASINSVDILNVDVEHSQGPKRKLIFEASVGADWWAFQPGALRSESLRPEGASLTEKFNDDDYIKVGTVGLWGPQSGDQRTGYKNNLINSGFLGYGGAQENFEGVRAGKKFAAGKQFTLTADGFVGTGDRGLTKGVAGALYLALCAKHDNHGCGLGAGVNIEGKSSLVPGLKLYTQFTRIGNGAGLYNESRLTSGGHYEHKAGPVTAIVEGDYTQAIHYRGDKLTLDVGALTFAAEKSFGKKWSGRAYDSKTRTRGAITEQFGVIGAAITCDAGASGRFSFDLHHERGAIKGTGATFSYSRTLHTFHLRK